MASDWVYQKDRMAIIAFFGQLPSPNDELRCAAQWFGWRVLRAQDYEDLGFLNRIEEVVAVLFPAEPADMCWRRTLEQIREATPQAKPIVCHPISGQSSWTEFAGAGVFHMINLPFKCSEIRQSLGFDKLLPGWPVPRMPHFNHPLNSRSAAGGVSQALLNMHKGLTPKDLGSRPAAPVSAEPNSTSPNSRKTRPDTRLHSGSSNDPKIPVLA
jgi:hypothetical protein